MKRRFAPLALLVIPIIGLFIVARNAASWRPQNITSRQLRERRLPPFTPPNWEDEEDLMLDQKQLKQRLVGKKWFPRALSPDESQVLVSCIDCEGVALVAASDGKVRNRLVAPDQKFVGEWRDAQFSPDGRYIEFSQFETTPPHVFDAQTGQLLWSADYWNAKFAFSPDETFSATTNGNEDFIIVSQTATGREVKRLPYRYNEGALAFSRDSRYLLAEVAPGQYRQLRLR